MKSKKAAIQANLFVLLTFVLAITTIFFFLSNYSESKSQIYSVNIFEKVELEKNNFRFLASQIIQESAFETYDYFLNKYFSSNSDPSITKLFNSKGEVEFSDFDKNLMTDLESEFKRNFIENLNQKNIGEDSFSQLIKIVDSDNFKVNFEKDCFFVSIKGIRFNNSNEEIEISYVPDFKFKFKLTQKGLHSPKDLSDYKNKCISLSTLEEKKQCYENNKNYLSNFNINVLEKEETPEKKYILLEFDSKREFLVGNELKKFRFNFVPKGS